MGKQTISKLFGVTSMSVEQSYDSAMRINLQLVAENGFDSRQLYEYKEWDEMFPSPVVVKCQYCSQWGARKTACKHCGGAIE